VATPVSFPLWFVGLLAVSFSVLWVSLWIAAPLSPALPVAFAALVGGSLFTGHRFARRPAPDRGPQILKFRRRLR